MKTASGRYKKLIEVALPLPEINDASAYDKMPGIGPHPKGIHHWWARLPLPTARAVLFASVVDDPSTHPETFATEEAQNAERERLFDIVRELMQKKLHERPDVYAKARQEMRKHADGKLPPVLDPFAGGGSIPLEAARLGFEAHAADLNPVAVLLNKCNLELVPRWLNRPPVNPEARSEWGEERIELREERSENALSGNDCLAESHECCPGSVPTCAKTTAGGDVWDEIADHPRGSVGSCEHSGGMDSGIRQGEDAVSFDRTGFPGRDRDVADNLRGIGLVSDFGNRIASNSPGRSQSDAHHNAPESKSIVNSTSSLNFPHSSSRFSLLFPHSFHGAEGLAEDVRYYGRLIRERAIAKIGHLYPKVRIVQDKDGSWQHATEEDLRSGKRNILEANVIAWIWVRTVASPNPAAQGAHVPLVSTYWLSSSKGKLAWLKPVVDKKANSWRFEVKVGEPPDKKIIKAGTKIARGAKFNCLLSDQPISDAHVKEEGRNRKIGYRLLAIVADLPRGRIYLPGEHEHENAFGLPLPEDCPKEHINYDSRYLTPPGYGMTEISSFFVPRQIASMVTISNTIQAILPSIVVDAHESGLSDEEAETYAKIVTTFLALALDRCSDFNNALCRWSSGNQKVMNMFSRQAIPMVWDFAEANMLGNSVGGWTTCSNYVAECIEVLGRSAGTNGNAEQVDAAGDWNDSGALLVSTDPPYYDNVPYAAISDFFYVWLRRTIGDLYPELFRTILVPKAPELTAAPERFNGDKEKAKEHFESGFRKTFTTLRDKLDPRFPLTVYYAFKQEDEQSGSDNTNEDDGEDTSNGVDLTTGWETLLDALLGSGFQITATWPVRASQQWRMRSMGSNALASYIVLACRPRPADAPQCSRRELLNEMKKELPAALKHLQQGNIAPVDLAQAAIGPGMAVFSRYAKVVESSGNAMTVRTALALINQTLDEVLAEQEAEFDAETRWALAWFDQHGMEEGEFGVAETLSRAKNTAVNGLVQAGIVAARGGKVRLVKRDELPEDWDPASDKRLTVWEATQHLIRALDRHGESGASKLLRKLGGAVGETARELSYRLHKVCEKKSWSGEALAYNSLVLAWPELTRLAQTKPQGEQQDLFA